MSQVDEFHYCAGLGGALPFSVADCQHCTEADYPPTPQQKLDAIRRLCEADPNDWGMTDFEGNPFPRTVNADAILAILDSAQSPNL